MLLQIRQVALDDLPPLVLVGQARLDAAQRLRDREVFLIEPLEATVDLIEVGVDTGGSISARALGLESAA